MSRPLVLALLALASVPSFAHAQPAATPAPAQPDDELEIPAAPKPAPPPAPAEVVDAKARAEQEALRSTIRSLEERLTRAEAAQKEQAAAVETVRAQAVPQNRSVATGLTEARSASPGDLLFQKWRTPGLLVGGYLQAQYETNQLSEDQLQQGGVALNDDQFLIRRARLRLDRRWKWFAGTVELDGNNIRGPVAGLRRAEGTFILPGNTPDAPPIAALTLGMTEVPFGFEMLESNRGRIFLERSLGSLAFFPGEPDTGLRLVGGLGVFRYAAGVYNGEPIVDRAGFVPRGDPNAAKDVVARLGVDTGEAGWGRVAGGVSVLHGKGFHAGRDATKSTVEWRDLNENAQIDLGELTPVPGSAATPSENFRRWALNVDLETALVSRIGLSRLYGELTLASNLDRGIFVANPVTAGVDIRHLAFYVAFLQTIGDVLVVGARYDYYDPNADFFDARGGKLIPTKRTIQTISPVVGAQLGARTRLLFQYDFVSDYLARDAVGVPTDLRNNRWTLRLQVEL